MKMYLLILAAMAACGTGCAGVQVVYRISFEHEGQKVGIKLKNNEIEWSADLTR